MADLLSTQETTIAELVAALENARLQLEYVNERHPMGTTAGIMTQIDHTLTKVRSAL